jgi:O-antigen/teichoic acid export membrane protein
MKVINHFKNFKLPFKKKLKKTLNHIAARGTIILINQFTLLLALPLIASKVDFSTFGNIAIGLVVVQISWLLCHWGVQNYSIENWHKLKKIEKNQIILMSIAVGLINASLILSFIYFAILNGWLDIPMTLFLSLFPSVFIGGINPIWFFQLKKVPQKLIIPTFGARILFISIIFIFIDNNADAYIFFLAQGTGLVIVCSYGFFLMLNKYKHSLQTFDIYQLISFYRRNIPYLINLISNNKINTLWGSGLSVVGGPEAMAIYNLGDEIYRFGSSISNVIAQAVRIHFFKNNMTKTQVINILFICFYFSFAILISLMTDSLLKIFFSSDYSDAGDIIKIMIFAWAINATVKLLNYPVLGKLYGISWLNNKTYFIILLHILFFIFWAIFFNTTLSMVIIFTIVNLIQLILYFFYYINFNPSNPYKDKNILKNKNYWS